MNWIKRQLLAGYIWLSQLFKNDDDDDSGPGCAAMLSSVMPVSPVRPIL